MIGIRSEILSGILHGVFLEFLQRFSPGIPLEISHRIPLRILLGILPDMHKDIPSEIYSLIFPEIF